MTGRCAERVALASLRVHPIRLGIAGGRFYRCLPWTKDLIQSAPICARYAKTTPRGIEWETDLRKICSLAERLCDFSRFAPRQGTGDTIYCRLLVTFFRRFVRMEGADNILDTHTQTCLSNIERRWETLLKHAHTLWGASPLSCSNKESCRFVVWPPYIVKIRTTVVLVLI